MDHHIQLMVSCKGYNCIIASKSTRFCQTGHCMETGKKNEVFTMENANANMVGIYVAANSEKHEHTSAKATNRQSRESEVNNMQTVLGGARHQRRICWLIPSVNAACFQSAWLHETWRVQQQSVAAAHTNGCYMHVSSSACNFSEIITFNHQSSAWKDYHTHH